AMKKGENLAAEIRASERALAILGGQLDEPVVYQLDGERREIVVVRKVNPTPPPYPRRPGVPVKRPL
ncbi:MAG: 16S rRNA (guanine(527)-N(7))-methyltransferase RsmG, partial [Chloroflexota bacterium]|nr:16S rRNA (guanine(527)-N(7))-methyltransferase RsmG [Chloroflexota bacterium]